MRKALMTMILAATAMVPVAAGAQDWHNRGDRGGHTQNQNESDNNGNNGNGRHSESRHEERQVQQQQQQPQVQVQQVPAVQNNRGNWRGNNGNGGGGSSNGGRTNGGNDGDRGNWRGNDNNRTSAYPQAWQGNPNDPALRHYQELERRNQNGGRNDWRDNRNDRNDGRDARNDGRGGRDGRSDWRNNDRHDRNWRNDWNRSWRNDNRFDWNRWRYSNRNIFHLSPYYSPYRNWGYQRFSIGLFLEPLFFDQRYWIGDPYDYRLPAAPYGTQWVRYYNDVVLVDLETGEVVDVIYDFFW